MESRRDESEHRTSITDPYDGRVRPVVGLKVPYAAAMATGKLPRLLLGQWTMLGKLRSIPDSVEEFTGFIILWDPIAGTFPGDEPYHAHGHAPKSATSNCPRAPATSGCPTRGSSRAMPRRAPGSIAIARATSLPLPGVDGVDTGNLVPAADIWFSIKKHWCLEAQRVIRQRRIVAARTPPG